MRQVVIVGSGPAGYTSAIYLSRAGLQPLVITGALAPGGQLVNTSEVENYPGFPDGIMGPDLMDAMRAQAERFGTEFLPEDVESINVTDESDDTLEYSASSEVIDGESMQAQANRGERPVYHLTTDTGEEIDARAVIIATGSSYRKLGVPGEERYSGHGVSYCATCDGFFFRDKPIVVVGGGDSAFEEALYLTRFGSSVTLIHRRDEFRASAIMVERAKANDKLTLMTNTVVTEILGEVPQAAVNAAVDANATETSNGQQAAGTAAGIAGGLKLNLSKTNTNQGFGLTLGGGLSLPRVTTPAVGNVTKVSLRNTVTGETGTLDTAAVFVAIGHTPATGFVCDLVAKDDDGYILVDGAGTRTSRPGVFAAGDCVDRTYRQAISAAGMGCRAALDAQDYLS